MTSEIQTVAAEKTSIQVHEISVLDQILVLAKHKKTIIGFPILVCFIAVAIVLYMPDEYTAMLKIAPSKNAPIYHWILTNDQVNAQVANEMKLSEHFGTESQQTTRSKMLEVVKVTLNSKDNFLDVKVTDTDPKFAALLANRMGLALRDNLYELRLLEISKQRYDLEIRRELALKNKTKIDDLIRKNTDIARTIELLPAAERYGVISLAAIQAESSLQVPGQGQVSDLMQNEMARLHNQLINLQRLVTDGVKQQIPSANTGIWIASIDALQQQAYWDALIERLDRRTELLRKQERDELKMTAAQVPDVKSGPKRVLIVLLSVLAAFVGAVLWALFSDSVSKLKEGKESSVLIDKIASALRIK